MFNSYEMELYSVFSVLFTVVATPSIICMTDEFFPQLHFKSTIYKELKPYLHALHVQDPDYLNPPVDPDLIHPNLSSFVVLTIIIFVYLLPYDKNMICFILFLF
jgi:hypothetical protein